ncbi:hypothetical protein [Alkalicoccus chagannorensis]|uniref:hypothetical protein n=1 Tax=Alkalicoccus chagannorensis TaxID=427072 RepID=UPI000429D6B5|nr:hypothetical protein [Alkalicoccus chagannorensis]
MTSKYESMSEAELRNYAAGADDSINLMQERMAELEFAMEDAGWKKLSYESEKEFSREGLQRINQLSRYFFLKNPLIRRAVLTQSNYVFGQGVEFTSSDPESPTQDILDDFIYDEENRRELTSHEAMMMKENELNLFANLFFVLFVDRSTKKTTVRTIPIDEITDIIMDPDDAKRPLFYKRERTVQRMNFDTGNYQAKQEVEYYKDWRVDDRQHNNRQQIGGYPVRQDAVVYHVHTNKLSDQKFGVSEIYAALDWARAYKEFLENWATITKAHSRFAWQMTTKGGRKGVNQAQQQLNSTMGAQGGRESNPPPVTASTFVGSEGNELKPVKTAGAQPSAADGQHMVHMVSAATGIFYHYLVGDPSTGNLATAKSMERPMELQFRNRQQLWKTVFQNIISYAIKQHQPDFEESIDVSFPSLLDHDTSEMIGAIVRAVTLEGQQATTMPMRYATKLLLQELGEENIDEKLDEWFPEGNEMPSTGTDAGMNADNADGLVDEALKEWREAVKHLASRREGDTGV